MRHGVKGVTFDKARGKYKARNGQRHIGEFDTEEEAALAVSRDSPLYGLSRVDLIEMVLRLSKELELRRMVEMHRI